MAKSTATPDEALALVPADAYVELKFRVKLQDVTVATSTKGQSKGQRFLNMPYYVEGSFGKKTAYLKGGRVIIPAVDGPKPAKEETDKAVALPREVLAGII